MSKMGPSFDFECDLSDSFDETDGICSLNMQKLLSFSSSQSENPNKLLGTLSSKYPKSCFEMSPSLDSPTQLTKDNSSEGNKCFDIENFKFPSNLQRESSDSVSTKNPRSKDRQSTNLKEETLTECKNNKEIRYWITEDSFGNVKAQKVSEESTQPETDSKKERLRQKKLALTAYFEKAKIYNKHILITRKPINQEKGSFSSVENESKAASSKISKLSSRDQTIKAPKDVESQESGNDCWREPLILAELSPISSKPSPKTKTPKTGLKDKDLPNGSSPPKESLDSPGPKKVTFNKASNEIRLIPASNKDFLKAKAQLKRDQRQLNFTLIGILPNILLGVDSE